MIPEAMSTKDIDGMVSNQGRWGSLCAQQLRGNSPSSPVGKIHISHRASLCQSQYSAHQRYCFITLVGPTAAELAIEWGPGDGRKRGGEVGYHTD